MDFLAPAGVIRWVRCDPSASLPQPRWPAPPSSLEYGSERLLRATCGPDMLVAKRARDAREAEAVAARMTHLAERGASVPRARALEGEGGSAWICTRWLEGRPWVEEGGDEAVAAAAIAKLHAAAATLPSDPIRAASRDRVARTLAAFDRLARDAEVSSLARAAGLAPAGLRERLEPWLAASAQPVHHDLHAGNLWWAEGSLWFLDFEDMGSAWLPPLADVMRYLERHLLMREASTARVETFWRSYHAARGGGLPGAGEAYCALAWNWIDSWTTLHGLAPRPAAFESERAKFLALLSHHASHWPELAARIDGWARA